MSVRNRGGDTNFYFPNENPKFYCELFSEQFFFLIYWIKNLNE